MVHQVTNPLLPEPLVASQKLSFLISNCAKALHPLSYFCQVALAKEEPIRSLNLQFKPKGRGGKGTETISETAVLKGTPYLLCFQSRRGLNLGAEKISYLLQKKVLNNSHFALLVVK
jgi:hypothetical protein